MPQVSSSAACLRIFGGDLDPDEITKLLGAPPTTGSRKNDIKVSRGREIRIKQGSWLREAEDCSPGNINAQVEHLLKGLTADLSVWREISSRYQCDIFCGFFMQETSEGEELKAETMLALAMRGLSFNFAIYGSTTSD